jgi:hypothetical protein
MTPELCDDLSEAFSMAIAAVRAKHRQLDDFSYQGSVVGFMVKTGILEAAKGGCPRSTMEASIQATLADAYGPKDNLS